MFFLNSLYYKYFNYNNSDNNNNNSNNNNNNLIIKLNSLIYNEIEPYLLFNCSNKRLLELSLISKLSFKNVSNYLTWNQKSIKYYPNSNDFLKCIENCQIYQYKLIKYKEIEKYNLNLLNTEMEEFKLKTKKECQLLNKIYFKDYSQISSYQDKEYIDDLLEFNNYFLYWDSHQTFPESFEEEFDQETIFKLLRYGDHHSKYQPEISFLFLKEYRIKKLRITTGDGDFKLHLEHLNNILINCKTTLKSINFYYHNTPLDFFIKSLETPSIKSLTVRFNPITFLNYQKNNQSNLFQHNKTLRKIKFKLSIEEIENKPKIKDGLNVLKFLLDQITTNGNNTNLTKLGLESFYLLKENQYLSLSPLINLPNIKTLYCNSSSIIQFINHIKINSNIETLIIVEDDFSNLFNSNKPFDFNNFKSIINDNKLLINIYLIKINENKKIKIF